MAYDPHLLGRLIGRIIGFIIVGFILFLLWKTISKKEIGEGTKKLSWFISFLSFIVGVFLLFLSYIGYTDKSTLINVYWISLTVAGIGFIFAGIMIILSAYGKLGKMK